MKNWLDHEAHRGAVSSSTSIWQLVRNVIPPGSALRVKLFHISITKIVNGTDPQQVCD